LHDRLVQDENHPRARVIWRMAHGGVQERRIAVDKPVFEQVWYAAGFIARVEVQADMLPADVVLRCAPVVLVLGGDGMPIVNGLQDVLGFQVSIDERGVESLPERVTIG